MDEKGQAGKDALICITLAEGQLVIALEKAEGRMNDLFIISCRLCERTEWMLFSMKPKKAEYTVV